MRMRTIKYALPQTARTLLVLSCLVLLVSVFAAPAENTCSSGPLEVAQSFQQHVDAHNREQAAALMADDALISTPFGRKTKDQFLTNLMGGSAAWEDSVIGDHERQVVTPGTRKLGPIAVSIQRTMEINEDNQISKITVRKKWQ